MFHKETYPNEWAQSQHNLAIAYQDRIRGDRADNQDKAISHFEAALTVIARETAPEIWAQLQHNMAVVYSSREHGDRSASRRKSIAAFEASLTVFTRDGYPHDHLRGARLLGRELLEGGDYVKAGQAFASAREAFLVLLGQGIEEADAKALLADAGPLFADAAFAAAQRGDAPIRAAARQRGTRAPADGRHEAANARSRARRAAAGWTSCAAPSRREKQAIETAQGTDRADAIQKLVALRGELLSLIEAGSRDGSGAALAAARAVAAEGGAVVVPIVTNLGGKIIVMSGSGDTIVVDVPELTLTRLSDLLVGKTSGSARRLDRRLLRQLLRQLRAHAALAGVARAPSTASGLSCGRCSAPASMRR